MPPLTAILSIRLIVYLECSPFSIAATLSKHAHDASLKRPISQPVRTERPATRKPRTFEAGEITAAGNAFERAEDELFVRDDLLLLLVEKAGMRAVHLPTE